MRFNYSFSQDNDTPALLGSIETSIFEKHSDKLVHEKSWLLSLSTYRAIVPIVLSLSSAYGPLYIVNNQLNNIF